MLAVQITPIGDPRTQLRALTLGLQPTQLNPVIGRSATNAIRTHLFERNRTHPNRLGGPRTNFWLAAARATNWREVGDHVVVSINEVGIAQRYFGGVIRPIDKTYLTQPAIPEAHGKRASEFAGLDFAFVDGRPALIRRPQTVIVYRTRKGTARVVAAREIEKDQVVFWLIRQANQKADPTVLPSERELEAAVQKDTADYIQRLAQR